MEKKWKAQGKEENHREYILKMKQTLQLMLTPLLHLPDWRAQTALQISVAFEAENRIIQHFAYMFIPGIPGPPKAFSGGLIAPP